MKYAPRKVYIKESGGYVELSYTDFCRRRQADKVQLSFALFSETFFNDTAEFTLCYGLHNCSPLLSRLLYPLA